MSNFNQQVVHLLVVHFVGHLADLVGAGGNDSKFEICWTVSFEFDDLMTAEQGHLEGEEDEGYMEMKGKVGGMQLEFGRWSPDGIEAYLSP